MEVAASRQNAPPEPRLHMHTREDEDLDIEPNERRKKKRSVQKVLLKTLDNALPREIRAAAVKNCAGSRSLGLKGRSLHNILADTVVAVRHFVKDEAGQMAEQTIPSLPPLLPPDSPPVLDMQTIGEGLFKSRDMFVLEVSMPGWSVVRLGEGAKEFYKKSPFGDMHGQSLDNLIDWEDVGIIVSLWQEMNSHGSRAHVAGREGAGGSSERAAAVRLIYFNKYRCTSDPQNARSNDQSKVLMSDLSHEAFLPDPLLDETAPSCAARPGDQAEGAKASDAHKEFYVVEFVTLQCQLHLCSKHGACERILVVASGLHAALQARVRFDPAEMQVSARVESARA